MPILFEPFGHENENMSISHFPSPHGVSLLSSEGGGHAISMQPTMQKDKMYRFTNL
jgi:hypothetical protein